MRLARFIFKLQAVLRQRELIEQQKQRALAGLGMQMEAMRRSLRDLEGRMRAVNDDLRTHRLVGTVDVAYLRAHRRYVVATQQQGLQLVRQMAALQQRIEQARAELAEAAKNHKAIQKLQEKQFERWKSEQDRREMADLDEVGMMMARRQQ
jgi:flagellar export protein FliJ